MVGAEPRDGEVITALSTNCVWFVISVVVMVGGGVEVGKPNDKLPPFWI